MKARSSKMNSPATRADAEDGQGWESVLLTLSIGVVLAASVGILLSSGIFVLLQMMENSYELEHAAHVGDFWGGLLSALVLAFVAVSLGLQARDRKLQARALQAQWEESTANLRVLKESGFRATLDAIQKQSERIGGFVIVDTKTQGEPNRKPFLGIDQIRSHLRQLNEERSYEAMEVYISIPELDAYMERGSELQSRLDQPNVEMDLTDFKTQLDLLCPEELAQYYETSRADRDKLIAEINKWCLDQREQEQLTQLVRRGWSLELRNINGEFVMTASIETEQKNFNFGSQLQKSNAEAAKALVAQLPNWSEPGVRRGFRPA